MKTIAQVGEVKWFSEDKNFGFIYSSDGNDYFLHGSNTLNFSPVEGDVVTFDLLPSKKKKGSLDAVCVAPLFSLSDRDDLLSIIAINATSTDQKYISVVAECYGALVQADNLDYLQVLEELKGAGIIPKLESISIDAPEFRRVLMLLSASLPPDQFEDGLELIQPNISEEEVARLYLDGVIQLTPKQYPYFIQMWPDLAADQKERILKEVGDEVSSYAAFCLRGLIKSMVVARPYDAYAQYSDLLKTFPQYAHDSAEYISSLAGCAIFQMLLWLKQDGSAPDFSEAGGVVSGLKTRDQRLLLRKIFAGIRDQSSQVNFDMLLDFVWTDISTWVALELLALIRDGKACDKKALEKEVYSYVMNHIKKPNDEVEISGYFDECAGVAGCKLSGDNGEELDQMPQDENEQEKVQVEIFRYPLRDRSSFLCEGRLSENLHNTKNQKFWWCRNGVCFKHSILGKGHADYNEYTFWDFLRILNLEFPLEQYQMMLSVLNRVRLFLSHLKCRDCGQIMHPKDQSNYSFYRVSRFVCKNKGCKNKEVVYLSHCLNWVCREVIDSRDSAKCKPKDASQDYFGWYVCRSCYSCCTSEKIKARAGYLEANGKPYKGHTDGHKDRGEVCCPDCGSVMKYGADKYVNQVNEWLTDHKDKGGGGCVPVRCK